MDQREVLLKKFAYSAHVSTIKRKKENLNPSVSDVPDTPSCSGIMIEQYIEHIKQLSETLELYKMLLNKDIKEICKVEEVIDTMDALTSQLIMKKF